MALANLVRFKLGLPASCSIHPCTARGGVAIGGLTCVDACWLKLQQKGCAALAGPGPGPRDQGNRTAPHHKDSFV
eukprot:2515306-Karenia_brevis.AAC.1